MTILLILLSTLVVETGMLILGDQMLSLRSRQRNETLFQSAITL